MRTLTETKWRFTCPFPLKPRQKPGLLMLASNNILNPKDGKPVVTPTQDMVIGIYYLTYMGEKDWDIEHPKAYSSAEEAQMAYELGHITLHEKIKVKLNLYDPEKKQYESKIMKHL